MTTHRQLAFRSPRQRAYWAIALLVLIALLSVVSLVANLSERELLQRIKDGDRVTLEEVSANDDRQAAIARLSLTAFVASAFTFIFWFFLTYRNLYALGVRGLRYSAKWTWLGFLIPVLNAFRPYQVAKEIWDESGSVPGHFDASSRQYNQAADILWMWWGSWLVLQTLDRIIVRFTDDQTVDQLVTRNTAYIIIEVAYIVAAGITIRFIWSLTQRQELTGSAFQKLAAASSGA